MAGDLPHGPYRIMAFREGVPGRLRFIVLLFFAFVFQHYGCVYLAGVGQMVGGKALLQEDIMMAAYASFVGMGLAFPLLFRIKFRFTTRRILIVVAVSLALSDVITMYSCNVFVLVLTCFIAGALRMVGTFECFSTLQLKITPTRNMNVFFPAIYTIILGAIQLSGIMTMYIDYLWGWRYMHVIFVGLLVVVLALAFFLMRDFRIAKKLPLYGIDWIGMLLWSAFMLSAVFVFEYGSYLDWFDSVYIRFGTLFCVVSLVLTLRRMFTVRRPFISPQLFRYRSFKSGLAMVFLMVVLFSTPTAIQMAFTGGIMHYDSLNSISLNWLVLAGVIGGTVFCWYTLGVLKMRYKPIIFVGFACIVAYQMMMYFLLDPSINIERLYIPSVLYGASCGILYVTLTVYPIQNVPFIHLFHGFGVLSFVRSGFVSVAASAMIEEGMAHLVKRNAMLLGARLDVLDPLASSLPNGALYGELMRQAMLVSMKEIMGWFTIGGLAVLLLILTMKYVRPVMRTLPKIKSFRRYIVREMQAAE